MKNNKKLLLAGFAIVPLALSSWTSDGSKNDLANTTHQENSNTYITEDMGTVIVGKLTRVNTDKPGPSMSRLDIETVKTKIVFSDDTLTPSNPSFEDIVKTYK
ncbi:hypothetical protein [Chryseobacterium sp. SIMBA_038]|uniref:hypothetical protein n=1 Tax=Chryseobacterium sp. SIMBA_038 TaxID=3085780 RepID=UPI00397A44FA